jgi:putative SOS response-associated peptidase YedK
MCGRFTLRTPAKDIAEFFDLGDVPELRPRYNIAPTQKVAAVRLDRESEKRELAFLHWGLIPSWADDPKIGHRPINARAETVATKPSFRNAFKKRRCLIVADGFYEWRKTNDKKQPFLIHKKDDCPFAFAGLWEHWKGDEKAIESCTIIVTEANDLMKPIHDRMPVILDPADYDLWLDPEFGDREKLEAMLRPYSGGDLESYPVSTVVNKPQNDVEKCVERVAADTPPEQIVPSFFSATPE